MTYEEGNADGPDNMSEPLLVPKYPHIVPETTRSMMQYVGKIPEYLSWAQLQVTWQLGIVLPNAQLQPNKQRTENSGNWKANMLQQTLT